MNKVFLTGRLTADAELRTTTSGKSVTTFSLAVNDGFGEKQKAYFFNVVVWGKGAEAVANYTHKGSKVAVTGKLTSTNLQCADLSNANVWHANVRNANLKDANLHGADLYMTNIDGSVYRPWLVITDHIGSRRSKTLYFADCDNIRCGCWNNYKGGTLAEFKARIDKVYPADSENEEYQRYRLEYLSAIKMFESMREAYLKSAEKEKEQ